LQVRHLDGFEERAEDGWPIPRTEWTELYLHPDLTLRAEPPEHDAKLEFEAMGDGLTFSTQPLSTGTEITGPLASKLWGASSTEDADLFIVVRVFDPAGEEVTFQGALDPHTPIAQGWLRASHRKLDPALSQRWRPYHLHDERRFLVPGEVYQLDIEIWPTSVVIPTGHRVALTVRGKDYEYTGPASGTERIASFKNRFTGCGPFLHDDPRDRPPEVFGGTTSLHLGPERPAHLLMPVIPPRP
ncbi:MAG: CocE/NonD family hydrolase C-terminal non-catalytic domain-containing protein, partial [Acidimicrobiia bacterium]